MTIAATLQLTTPTDREIVMTRVLAAPRALVFEAFTTPALLKRWLLGPPGWSMPVCEVDLRVGGRYRYEWRNDGDGTTMGMGGVYRELAAPERIVSTERFDQAWYPGEGIGTLVLVERDGRTTATHTILYESKAARDAVLKSGMERGVAAGYDRLDVLLASPRPLRSIAAVLAGFISVVILSLATDQVLHVLKVYPPWGQPMFEPGLNLLALSYRMVYSVLGSYIAARLAPRYPMWHAVILGVIGLPPGVAGVVVAFKTNLGPAWYPVALVVATLPCAWLGGALYRMKHQGAR